jgi:hypothetical protein
MAHILCKRLSARSIDVKVLDDTKLLFRVMSITALPFVLVMFLTKWYGSTAISYVSVFSLLWLQGWLHSSGVDGWISTAGSVGGIGIAFLVLVLWLFGWNAYPNRLLELRKRMTKVLKVPTMVIVCMTSFSILAWSTGPTLKEVSKTVAGEEYQRLLESLDKLEATLKIVWGQRLAAVYVDHQLAVTPTTSQDRSQGQATKSDPCEQRERQEDSCPAAALFNRALDIEGEVTDKYERVRKLGGRWDGPSSGALTEQLKAFDSGAVRPAARPVGEPAPRATARLAELGEERVSKVHHSAARACSAVACDKAPTTGRSLSQVTKLLAELAVQGIEAVAPEIKLPTVLNELGEFWQSLRKTISKSPLKGAVEAWIDKSLQRIVKMSGSVEGVVLPEDAMKEIKSMAPRGPQIAAALQTHVDAMSKATTGLTEAIARGEQRAQERAAEDAARAAAEWAAARKSGNRCPEGQVPCRCSNGRDYGCRPEALCSGPCS